MIDRLLTKRNKKNIVKTTEGSGNETLLFPDGENPANI